MVEVVIDSIRVSLMSQHRVVVLKDVDSERFLPIWIGGCEADAITVELQEVTVARPLTHDLLKSAITDLGGTISQIQISDLRNDVFFARIVVERGGKTIEIDSRPSDAIALAVRARVPILVDDAVMDKAAVMPEEEMEGEGMPEVDDERLAPYKDFLDTLDLDKLGGDAPPPDDA